LSSWRGRRFVRASLSCSTCWDGRVSGGSLAACPALAVHPPALHGASRGCRQPVRPHLASPRDGSWSPARSGVAGHGTGRGGWCLGAGTATPAPCRAGTAGPCRTRLLRCLAASAAEILPARLLRDSKVSPGLETKLSHS